MPNKDKSYKELQAELDEVLLKLQSAEIDVDEAVKLYERGLKLVRDLEAHLKLAENKIAKLKTEK